MTRLRISITKLVLISILSGAIQSCWANDGQSEVDQETKLDETKEINSPVFNRQYQMKDESQSPDHFDENSGQKWKLQINFSKGLWSGKDQGVKASGKTACTTADACSVLNGTAEVKGCKHSIKVTPDGASFALAKSIWVQLGNKDVCDNTPHKHDGEIHGGTAHGTNN